MESLKPLLAEHPFFSGLDERALDSIVGCASNVRCERGEFIAREGREANHFYLIREDTVSLEIFSAGRGPIVVQTLEKGDILGWSWLISPYFWHFDARALEPTRMIVLDGRCLRTKCEEDLDLGYELLKRLRTHRQAATRGDTAAAPRHRGPAGWEGQVKQTPRPAGSSIRVSRRARFLSQPTILLPFFQLSFTRFSGAEAPAHRSMPTHIPYPDSFPSQLHWLCRRVARSAVGCAGNTAMRAFDRGPSRC